MLTVTYDKKNDCFNFYEVIENKKVFEYTLKRNEINILINVLTNSINHNLEILNLIYFAQQR